MLAITGSAGFIGSYCALHFAASPQDLVLVDHDSAFHQHDYLKGVDKSFLKLSPEKFLNDLSKLKPGLIIHMGAITDTGEKDTEKLKKWNTEYTQSLWTYCAESKIPFIYASSAATYGDGALGFSDDVSTLRKLKSLNPYGQSKHVFDLWALEQKKSPPAWYGLKFFNVYGPHENHKGRMASSIWHGYNEIKKTGEMTLFRSHNPGYKDGEQARDFIYVKDILKIIEFLIEKKPVNGIYNCGTGQAETFLSVASALFSAFEKPMKIHWIDTPLQYREAYQYHTQAETSKLRNAGFKTPFTSIEAGVSDYVKTYLSSLG